MAAIPLARSQLFTVLISGAVGAAGGYYYRGKGCNLNTTSASSTAASAVNSVKSALGGGVEPDVTLQAHPECKSLLKKCLTKDVVEELKNKKTSMGSTLWDVIRSGVFNLDSGVGVYAADYESYRTFGPLFDRVIEAYHGFKPTDRQPPVDLGEKRLSEFQPLDPEGKYIISTRIRCGRTLKGYPFNPSLKEDQYLEMEKKVKGALESVSEKDLKAGGKYYALDGMSKKDQQQLIDDHFLFKEGDRFLQHANACRFWPKGRGIFHNQEKNFLVWVNEEDHLRLISMQQGSDVGKVLDRLIRGIKAIENKVPFARDERLGWLTFCPTNLGSTVRASVHIKLPKVSARPDFKELCDKLGLQPRGVHGEHSESAGGVYDISNKARLGKSESKMGEVDVLFEVRNFYFLGSYQQCVKEAQKVSTRSDEVKLERDIFLYRAYIALGKSNIVLAEIPESGGAQPLKAIRRLASYYSERDRRTGIVEKVEKEYVDGSVTDEYTLLVNGLILLNERKFDSAICVFNRSSLLEAKALAVQSLLKVNRADLALKMLKRMQEIDEDATLTQLCLAWLHLFSVRQEKLHDAFYIYQELIDKYGATANLLISQAATMIMQGKTSEAESLIAQAEDRDGSGAACRPHQPVLTRTLKQLKLEHPDDDWVRDYVEHERQMDEWEDEEEA
ncbi:Arginine kinase [Aphelenchoides fujianensis]|nr:Arginine kinase [Aphelenchoides fujianensis]